MSLLATRALAVGYRRAHILTGVDVAADAGQLIAVVGPNGSGKSTLLRTLAGLQPALDGQVLLDGRPRGAMRSGEVARFLATVLTDRIDVAHLRVRGLVELGRHPHLGTAHLLRSDDHRLVAEAMGLVGAEHLADRVVATLSDGQRQRALIARALAQQPRLLLLDEPTSFLDPVGRLTIFSLLRRLAHDHGLAVVVCTHEVELALDHADALWVVGDGTVTCGTGARLAADGRLAAPFLTDGIAFDAELSRFCEVTR